MGEKKILEGLWDCPYCGAKGIRGLTKHCPNCGHPQDQGTTFYLGNAKNYLDEEKAKQYGQGADWTCSYCGSLNRVHHKFCTNCGGPKDETSGDYFDNQKKMEKAAQPAPEPQRNNKPQKSGGLKRFAPFFLILLGLLLVFNFFLRPKNADVKITDKSWARSIDVEGMVTYQEKDWDVPDGGRVYQTKREIHHYQDVIDHYETRTREVPEQVYDGEEYHTRTVNNGDGTFTEETYSTPRYRTEYRTEYYDAPVYRQEPVYATMYYYEIDRWPVVRTEESSGKEDEPYWPQVQLAELEREGAYHESYNFTAQNVKKEKTYDLSLPQSEWEKLKVGDAVEITLRGSKLIKINGVDLEQ